MKKNKNEKTAEKKSRVVSNRKVNVLTVILSVIMLICFGLFFAARWYFLTYGDIGFESIMFTMLSGLNGVQSGLVSDYIVKGLIPTVLCWAVCSGSWSTMRITRRCLWGIPVLSLSADL